MKVRIPFELKDGKTYHLKYELTLPENKAILLGVANASSTNSYDGVFSEGNRFTISNGMRTAGTHTVEYTFVADITNEAYNKLGLIFWATAADATVTVDNLEISEVQTDKNSFDFSTSSDLEYAIAKYGNGSAKVENGALNLSLKNNHCMKVRLPFTLEDGKTYHVKYELTLPENKALLLGIANASSTNSYDGVFSENNKFTISNGYRTAGTHTVEYTFVADITDTTYNKLGLIFWATSADATVSVDNLEITEVELNKNSFDFSSSSDVEYAIAKYGNGSATVGGGALNLVLQNNRCMKIRIPFAFENGKNYKVTYDLIVPEDKALLLGIAYASSTNSYDGVFNENNRLTISNGLRTAGTHKIEYTFTAELPDESRNKLGLIFWATAADANVTVDNLEIKEVEQGSDEPDTPIDPPEVHEKFDFSEDSHASALYAPDGAVIEDEAIKVEIKTAYNYAKIKIPFTLIKGETYHVSFKIKAAQPAALITVLGAYAHETQTGYGMIKNRPTTDTKYVFDAQNVPNFKKDRWKTVTYSFTADYADGYNQFGLFIQSYVLGTYYIDNLEITNSETSPFKPDEELSIKDYDFSNEDQLDYGSSAQIESGELKFSFDKEWAAGKTRFPFKLENGKAYELTFKARSDIMDKTIHFWTAYAVALDNWDVIKNTDSEYVAAKTYKRFYDDGWDEYSFTFVANSPEERYQYLGLFIQSTAAGNVWVDDMHIREVRLVDLKANYKGMDIEMDQLVASATGDIDLPKLINKQFSVEGWYLDSDLKQSIGFTLKTDKISSTVYAKVKYNNKVVIDFEGENEDITISQSNSTTKKMVKEDNNTYLSFSVAKAYDQLVMRTNYLWSPNRSYKLTMRYKFSGTVWLEMGLLRADATGNSGSGFTQTVVYPMQDTYGICDWKELVIEFNTQEETFEDAFKYIKMLVWFKEGTDAFLSIDDIVLEDLGEYKESEFKPNIDAYEWEEFKEDKSLYTDWQSWNELKANKDGNYVEVENDSSEKSSLNIVIPIAIGSAVIIAGAVIAIVLIKKKKSKA